MLNHNYDPFSDNPLDVDIWGSNTTSIKKQAKMVDSDTPQYAITTLREPVVTKTMRYVASITSQPVGDYFAEQTAAYLNSICNLKDYQVTITSLNDNALLITLIQK